MMGNLWKKQEIDVELPIKKPEGEFVLLPIEPTTEMINAYDEAREATTLYTRVDGRPIVTYNPHQSYWAMLHAAPVSTYPNRMVAALEHCMVGGNHIAGLLVQKLGPDFADKYPPNLDPESALRMLCATDEYELWCCWSAIMRARDSLGEDKVGE